MSGLAIVALPREGEHVNKISSEKAAHLTLLYLGEQDFDSDTLINIVRFVEHAASELSPFGLTVDYRDTLGEDKADVLFFEKNSWTDLQRIVSFRGHLLQHQPIKTAYDSVPQFPEWTPHLTLGYPEAPAKEVDPDDEHRLNHVSFDRIAVWTEDFDGPTFRLHYDEGAYAMDVAMSDTAASGADAIRELFHYGVKGMKWGVRNDRGHEGEVVKTKKLDKLDKKWEQNEDRNAFWQAYNAAAGRMNNGEIDRINQKIEHKKAADEGKFEDWENPTPELDAYMKDMDDTFNRHFANAMVARGSNPSGSKAYKLRTDPDGSVYAELATIKHAAIGDKDVRFKIALDDKGMIKSYTPEEVELKHYGVKGMKWGVTKADKAASVNVEGQRPMRVLKNRDVTVTQRKPGRYAKARGGQRQIASDDAVKAVAARQKAKKSTTDALTNDELKAANERMRLEQEFAKLNSKTKRRGESFVAQLFRSPDGRQIAEDLAKRVAATQ